MNWDSVGTALVPLFGAANTLMGYQKQHPYFGIVLAGVTAVLVITVFVRGMQGRLKSTETFLSLPVPFLLATHLVSTAGILLVQSKFDTQSYEFNYALIIITVDFLLGGWFVIADKDSSSVASALSCSVLSISLVGLSAYLWVM